MRAVRIACCATIAIALFACAGQPPRDLAVSSNSVSHLYVVRRAWHIDIAFDARDLLPELIPLAHSLGSPRVVVIGFGDRHYLQARTTGFVDTLEALWPGDAVLLVTGLKTSPAAAFGSEHVVTVAVTPSQLAAAERYVSASLRGPVEPLSTGPYSGSLFFDATDHYSAVHTCNTWAAETLRAGGLPVHAAGVIFAGQLWTQMSRLQRE